MVRKAPKVPECPNGLANLLQNLFSDSTKWEPRGSQSGDENGVSRRVRRRAISLVAPAARLSVCSAKTHFLEEWSALVDDFRTFVASCDLDN